MKPGFRGHLQDVVAGNLVISTNTGERLAVWRAYRHPDFNDTTYANDYALLRLKSDAKEPPVRLASESDTSSLVAKAELSVAGWGDTAEDSRMGSDQLLYTKLPFIARSECAKSVPDLQPEAICAAWPEGGKDTCQGDSGGPLFAQIGGKQTQVALVSWGLGCARPNTPGVYAGVASASSWITSTMAQGESDVAKFGTCVAGCDKASACTETEDPVTCEARNETCMCDCAGAKTGLCDLSPSASGTSADGGQPAADADTPTDADTPMDVSMSADAGMPEQESTIDAGMPDEEDAADDTGTPAEGTTSEGEEDTTQGPATTEDQATTARHVAGGLRRHTA
jgi:Trypsin